MKTIHISQKAIRDNVNTGSDWPVITVHDHDGSMSNHHEYTIADGIRIVYDPVGVELDGWTVRVWIEVDTPGDTCDDR
jgi:hypothetical protein